MTRPTVHVLDYGAGNVRSLLNAITAVGYDPVLVSSPAQLASGEVTKLVFPGVGAFGAAMAFLRENGYVEPLRAYLRTPGRKYFGICIGLQTLFEASHESPGVEGLGVIPGTIASFPRGAGLPSVPHIGWSGVRPVKASRLWGPEGWAADARVYFVHSFRAPRTAANEAWVAGTTTYGADEFVSAVQMGDVMAVQFHPEKSGAVGLALLKAFLDDGRDARLYREDGTGGGARAAPTVSRRIVACLDVRTNDEGDLVVTKGDSYDVREKAPAGEDQGAKRRGVVRNLGKPVDLARRYYEEGADEVTFLNITSFRSEPLEDAPMLAVLEEASRSVFVPMTIGGGIRDYTDDAGRSYSALQVADRYFRAGADKVSIGSDAVLAAERLLRGEQPDGKSCIEQISRAYGAQAVVISVDPRRVYLDTEEARRDARARGHTVVRAKDARPGRVGEDCDVWYQCTIKGGREGRDVDAVALAKCCERLGAGEMLINSIDADGQKSGFDAALVNAVAGAVTLPVIASSGAGAPKHFVDVFQNTRAEAALAAGIFHRKEVPIADVKRAMVDAGLPVRL